jgi:hypothetical protein
MTDVLDRVAIEPGERKIETTSEPIATDVAGEP